MTEADKVWVLQRADTGHYYTGPHYVERRRWAPELRRAKKYKRPGDAKAAVTNMYYMKLLDESVKLYRKEYNLTLVHEELI